MSEDVVITIFKQALFVVIKTAAPMLLVSLIIGLLISIFQTVTSIQEQTLTFVPKFLGIILVIILAGNWIMGEITALFTELCSNFSIYIQS
jgi:flagellar biosynthetic protein FliQ